MIDDKKIEEAAIAFDNKAEWTEDADAQAIVQYSFKKGAAWAIEEFKKSLWHDASEEPKSDRENETCFGICRNSSDMTFCKRDLKFLRRGVNYTWQKYIAEVNLLKWAYLEDFMQIGRKELYQRKHDREEQRQI